MRSYYLSIILAIAAANMWQLVAIGLPVHGVIEVGLAVPRRIHCASTPRSHAALNTVRTLALRMLRR